MFKKIKQLVLIIMMISSYAYAGFHAEKLNGWEYWWSSEILKCETRIEAYGLFYETTLDLKIRLGKSDYWDYYAQKYICQNPPSGDWEFVWDFNLPQDAYIKDFQVWDDSKSAFTPAKIIDLTTAESNYQSNRTQRLSALLRQYMRRDYNGSYNLQYNLKIGPVRWDGTAEFTITYVSPCRMQFYKRLITDYTGQFYTPASTYSGCNSNAPLTIYLNDYNNPDTAPKNFMGINNAWYKSNGSWVTSSDYSMNGCVIELAPESNSGSFLRTYADNDNKFYQLAVNPHLDYEKRSPRNIVMAFDLIGSTISTDRRTKIIDKIETPLILSTTDKDSIAFVTSSFNVNWIDDNYFPRTETLINQRLSQIKNMVPKLNTLPYMLKEIADFIDSKDRDAEIWIVSDDYQTAKRAETVMELLQQAFFKIKKNVKFRILDVADSYYSYYILNKYYNGNAYLYENLSRLTGGTFEVLRDVYELSWVDKVMDCFAPMVTTVEIDPMPLGGVAFSAVNLNEGRNNFDIADRYFQLGMFEGTAPFNLSYYGYFTGENYFKNIDLSEDNSQVPDNILKNTGLYWYGNYIMQDLFMQPQSYSTIQYIEDLSVANRIITPYSGFIIPGPEGYSGFNRIYEDSENITAVDSTEIQSPPTTYEIELSAYPNPFNPSTKINITIPPGSENSTMVIYNILGQKVRAFDLNDYGFTNKFSLTWDGMNDYGSPVASGTYIAVLKTPELLKSIKLLLIR